MRFGLSGVVPLPADAIVPVPWDTLEASEGEPLVELVATPTLRFLRSGFYLITVFLATDNAVSQPLIGIVLTAPENNLAVSTTQGGNQNPTSAELSTTATIMIAPADIVGPARLHLAIAGVSQIDPNELRVRTNVTIIRLGDL